MTFPIVRQRDAMGIARDDLPVLLSMKSRDSADRLEKLVDRYLDGIMTRVREQIRALDRKDLSFMMYLYAGFSPRAVCIFTGIRMQNFYKRRERLRERILASDAPDRELFVSRMGMMPH